MHIIKKIKQGFYILKLTGFKYYRASQLQNKNVIYKINKTAIVIEGHSVLSMLLGIVISDEYHLKKQQHKPRIIIDVGANVGIFSIYAAILFPDCCIYALEPSAKNFHLLKKNTSSFSKIRCFNKGISNYNGVAYLSGKNDNTAFKTSAVSSFDTIQQCDITTLASFTADNSINTIDILKLDCEGAEYDIVKTDLKNVRQVVGEYHHSENETSEHLKNEFMKQGFAFKQWTGSPHYFAGLFWAVNNLTVVND